MFIKRFNKMHLRRLLTVVGVFLLSITLTACGGGNRMPNGSIGSWGRYASINENLEITHLDLWNELRFSSIDVLNDVIDEIILEEQMQRIRTVLDRPEATSSEQELEEQKEFRDLLDDFALRGIFDTDERGFARLTPRERMNRAEVFIANQEINNHEHIAAIEVSSSNVVKATDIVPFEDSREIEDLRLDLVHHFFYRDLAMRLFALSELESQIEEHNNTEDDPFHSESEILNHFRENFEHTGDVHAIIIPFVSNAEAMNTLRSFGIKVHNGQWFYIPSYEGEDFLTYSRRFDDITINLNDLDDSFVPLAAIGMEAVLQIFIEIYNFIYGFRPVLASGLNITQAERNALGSDRRIITRRIIGLHTGNHINPSDAPANIANLGGDFTEFERDELEDLGSISFRNFIYRDLTSLYEAMHDTPEEVFEVFNATPQTFGTENHFLIFKLNVEEDLFLADFEDYRDIDVVIECEETGNDIVNPYHPLRDIIISELNDLHVTTAFINTTMADARNEISVRIFDNILEISFSLQNPDQSRTLGRAPNNYTMAIISFRGETHYLTVYNVFERLELTIGTSTAVDLLTRQYMKTTDHFRNGFTQADTDDFLRTLNITLARFSNNEFAAQGFPASMGAHNFMLMQFRTARVNDIINDFFKVNATMTHYINNFLSLDGEAEDGLINMFQEFTNLAMENFLSFSGLSLFIYLDDNDDGQADQLEGLTAARYNQFNTLSRSLEDRIRNLLQNVPVSQQPAELQRIVTEFNNTARHAAYGSAVAGDPNFDPSQPELIWAEYRFMGIRLEIVEFNSITNTSDSTAIPNEILNRAADLFENDSRLVDNEHISVPFVDSESTRTDDGVHIFAITAGQLAPDFTFDEDNDLFELLQNIPIVIHGQRYILTDLRDDEGNISHNQILLFIFQSLQLSGTGISIVPSDILPAMNAFFAPVFNRFNSQTTQRELLIFFVEQQEGNTISFFGDTSYITAARNARFNRIRATGKLLEDNFNNQDDMSNNFYGWWDALDRVIRNGGNNNA